MKTYLAVLFVILMVMAGAMYAVDRATTAFTDQVFDIAGAPATIHHDDGTTTRIPVNYALYNHFHRDVPEKFKEKD